MGLALETGRLCSQQQEAMGDPGDVTGLEVCGVSPRHLVLVRQRNEVAFEV